jgi:hypothetical protein
MPPRPASPGPAGGETVRATRARFDKI